MAPDYQGGIGDSQREPLESLVFPRKQDVGNVVFREILHQPLPVIAVEAGGQGGLLLGERDKMLRAIHIIPHFVNEHRLEELRKRHDPLYGKIASHITLVFPFESEISSRDLERHVKVCVSGTKPFPILMRGVTGAAGGYLFLNVKRGSDEIVQLHDGLYSGVLSDFLERRLTYVPHLTVGRVDDSLLFHEAVSETLGFGDEFEAVVSSVSIESISETGLSHIEAVIDFGSTRETHEAVSSAETLRETHGKTVRGIEVTMNGTSPERRRIRANELRSLYNQAGWWPNRTLEDIGNLLVPGVSVGAWDGEKLIGFARAVSDGVFRAYIEDVVVDEAYRRRGVGDRLIHVLMDELRHLEVVSLFCEEDLTTFYERNGFQKTSQVVMHRKGIGS